MGKPPINTDDKTNAIRFSYAICLLIEREAEKRKAPVPLMFGLKMGGMAHATFMVVRSKIRPFSLAELFSISKAIDWPAEKMFAYAFLMMEEGEV